MLKRLPAITAGLLAFTGSIATANAGTTCNTVAACAMYQNIGSGVGIEGVSSLSVGVYGVSTNSHGVDGRSQNSFGSVGITYANGSTPATARVGLLGEDLGSGSYNGGVYGLSTNGAGTQGSSTNSYGVYGVSTNTYGVVGVGGFAGAAFFGGATNSPYSYGVIGEGNTGGYFYGENAGTGIYVDSTGAGVYINTSNQGSSSFYPSLQMESSGSEFISGFNDVTQQEVVSFDGNGNATIAGTLTQNGTALARTHTTTGVDVASYGARSSSPTIEDFGAGVLRNGVATVELDKTFASTIAPGYMVFVTPHGDSHSLYTRNNASEFIVRESEGGRSSLAFDYRIVGHPIDATGAHLAAMTTTPHLLRAHIKLMNRPNISAPRKMSKPLLR